MYFLIQIIFSKSKFWFSKTCKIFYLLLHFKINWNICFVALRTKKYVQDYWYRPSLIFYIAPSLWHEIEYLLPSTICCLFSLIYSTSIICYIIQPTLVTSISVLCNSFLRYRRSYHDTIHLHISLFFWGGESILNTLKATNSSVNSNIFNSKDISQLHFLSCKTML